MIRKRSGLARIIHVHPLRTFFLVRELVIYIMVGTLPRRQQDAISRTLLTAVQDFSPILKRSLHVLRNVRLGAMTACTLVIAKELLVAALTPCARLCGLVRGQLAPLSLPSLWLSLPEPPQVIAPALYNLTYHYLSPLTLLLKLQLSFVPRNLCACHLLQQPGSLS
ncbi:uncharacterized protein [Dermacentor andersoni]|uniref:uncharacterized protein n=1 Tax=Dermacentor andersoni TaxID=34620 RepID=UPI003B3BE7F3